MTTIETYNEKSKSLGVKAGANAAEWAIQHLWGGRSGRHAKECAQSVLRQLDEGDPSIYDSFSLPSLSGEWADEMTQEDLFWKICKFEYDPEEMEHQLILDDISTEWESGVSEGFFSTLEQSARDFLSN
jgi:hypothetical protein